MVHDYYLFNRNRSFSYEKRTKISTKIKSFSYHSVDCTFACAQIEITFARRVKPKFFPPLNRHEDGKASKTFFSSSVVAA